MTKLIFRIIFTGAFCTAYAKAKGFACVNTNYRIFVALADAENIWLGRNVDAQAICRQSGHVLAENFACTKALLSGGSGHPAFAGKRLPRKFWVANQVSSGGSSKENSCLAWSRDFNSTIFLPCTEHAGVVCQGLSTEDHVLSEAQTDRSPVSDFRDPFYLTCLVVGILLIVIIIIAASCSSLFPLLSESMFQKDAEALSNAVNHSR